MKTKIWAFILLLITPFCADATLITHHQQLKPYQHLEECLLVASPPFTKTSVLVHAIQQHFHHPILETHLLPPSKQFKGKVLFIFSNPDKLAETALHKSFCNMKSLITAFGSSETSDKKWLKRMFKNGKANHQNDKENLLNYDALGLFEMLDHWLTLQTQPCNLESAQILAVKYEHLGDTEVQSAISNFLKVKPLHISLSKSNDDKYTFASEEVLLRRAFNLNHQYCPRYSAYNKARAVWESAPSFQFYCIK